MSTKRILVVDDDRTHLVTAQELLEDEGYEVLTHVSAFGATERIMVTRPDLVLLDVNMPGIDGYEVLAATRNESLPVRVILLTARQTEADITRGFTLGADDYVVKPFNPPELLARVKRYL